MPGAASYGFDSVNYIYNIVSGATRQFGTGSFYVRYENPSPGAAPTLMTSSSAVQEFRTGWDWGIRYFVPNTEPHQPRLNGTTAMGQQDAVAFCEALRQIYQAVGPLLIPSSLRVDCYLSLEAPTNLSTAYWNGWANYVDGYQLAGVYPLYPGMYCNPGSTARNCSSAGAGTFCYSVWSSEHESCSSFCGRFGTQSWDAETCFNSPGSVGPTLLWQMAIQDVCLGCHTTWPNVDADMTNPGYFQTGRMFYLESRP